MQRGENVCVVINCYQRNELSGYYLSLSAKRTLPSCQN